MKHIFTKPLLIATALLLHCHAAATGDNSLPQSTVTAVAGLHLPSMTMEDMAEQAAEKKIQEENAKKAAAFQYTKIKEVCGPVEQLKTAYMLHNAGTYNTDCMRPTELGKTTLSDLSLFCGDNETPGNHVFSSINRTQTQSGYVALQTMLASPTYDVKQLKKRQAFIQLLTKDEKLYQQVVSTLKIIKDNEAAFLSIAREMKTEIETHYRDVLFNFSFLKKLNLSPAFMHGGTYYLAGRELAFNIALYSLMAGTLYAFSGQQGLRAFIRMISGAEAFDRNLHRDLRIGAGIQAGLFYFNMGFGLYQFASRLPTVLQLKAKMSGVGKTLVSTHRDLANILMNHPEAQSALVDLEENTWSKISAQEKKQILQVLQNLDTNFFQAGHAVTAFERKAEIKENFADSYKFFGVVDAYTSLATLMREFTDQENGQYCFAEYVTNATPVVEIKNFWHPMLNPNTVVTNDIALGAGVPLNAIITGPNAGGKTTSLRCVGLSILMAQTVGIVPAHSAKITPFALFATYLGIADSEGKESLFQAEMRRAQEFLTALKNLPANQFSFIMMDEIFTGTNPKEGVAGAYGIAKKLSSYPNSVALITTHFIDLTALAAETNLFTNLKVAVTKTGGTFQFPYKLEHGITDQAIALDLLGQEGFDKDILSAAHDFMARKEAAAKA